MIEINAKIKKWGNSLGFIIPKDIASKQHIKQRQNIRVFIEKSDALRVKDIFAIGKVKINADKALREIDSMFGD